MIRVVFIAADLQTGGVQSQWYELIKNLDRERFEPSLICLYDLGQMGREIERLGVPCRSHLMRSRFSVGGIFRLAGELRKARADVAFIWNQPLTMLYGSTASRLAGVKGVITAIHSTGYLQRHFRNIWVNRLCLRFADRIVAVGDPQREHLIREMGFPADKLVTIFNGTDTTAYAAPIDKRRKKAELGIPEDVKLVGIIGRLHAIKRHDVFLEAARLVIQVHPRTIFLIIGDGDERPRIEKKIRELSLAPNVKMLGHRSDVAEINRILDVSALCSDTEALPMTIIESMASSVPVVATNVGSLSDLVRDGQNGILVPAGDASLFAAAIIKLIKDPALAARMGERGREIALAQFTLNAMVLSYQSLFKTVCLGAKPKGGT